MKVRDVIRAIDIDGDSESGWLRRGANALNGDYKAGDIVEPRELCIRCPEGWMWVRFDGSYVSRWSGPKWDNARFGRFNAWRIRRAVARWAHDRWPEPQTQTKAEGVESHEQASDEVNGTSPNPSFSKAEGRTP